MTARLKKVYLAFLTPAIAGFVVAYAVRTFHQSPYLPDHITVLGGRLIFVLAAFIAVACPVLYRSLFAGRQRNSASVPQTVLLKFERNLIRTVMTTPYLALIAYFFRVPRFYSAGILLLALYAIYYYYPSEKRIMLDQRIFRSND